MPASAERDDLQQVAHEHLLLHFARNGAFGPDGSDLLILDRGEGPYVFDRSGRRYLDALSSHYCAQIGYSYGAEMAEVASAQLQRLAFNSNLIHTAHQPGIELAEQLAARAPAGIERVFFTTGGSEANEAAWKLARQFHLANGEPERRKAIARRTAYHGVTLGALSLTGVDAFKEPFGPSGIPVRHVSNTNGFRRPEGDAELCAALLAELEAAIEAEGPETIAMLIAEPVQNAGGCLLPPAGYWPGLRALCDAHGILLVADEVITGCGRLGEWFAVTKFGATPDMITLAKGLTSAYAPLGAVMVSDRVAAPFYEADRVLLHAVTFGGHPVSAAICLRNLEIFARDRVLENVRANEPYLAKRMQALRELPIVGDIRGGGYFWAAEMVPDGADGRFDADQRAELIRRFMPARLLEAGLLARADDRGDVVVQVAPPLISDRQVLDEVVTGLEAVLVDAGRHMGVTAG